MVRAVLVVVLAALLAPAGARADTVLPAGFAETTAYSVPGEYLTSVRFAPGGQVFALGKGGIVYAFDGPGDSTPTVFADLRLQTFDGWDRGLVGLAVDPDYDRGRPYLYVSYTYDKAPGSAIVPAWSDLCPVLPNPGLAGCTVDGRVSRLGPDGSETVLLDGFCMQSLSHTLGTLAFGRDGALYVSAGDGAQFGRVDYGQDQNPCGDPPGAPGESLTPPTALGGALRAQSPRRPAGRPASLDGTLLRIDPDTGAAPASNPAAADADPVRRRIVAYGLRNPFRFTVRPGTDELWVGDVGFGTWEEIDRVPDVASVRNYGWPCFEGRAPQEVYEAAGLDACRSLSAGATVDPYFTYRHADPVVAGEACPAGSSSISGLAFYSAPAFPARYRGALFFADYSRGCIWAMLPGADGLPDPARVETFASGAAEPVDLQVGPDGALYYPDVYGGTIRRIAPVTDAPTARIAVTGDLPGLSFDATGSTGTALTYAWDLDGDGAYDDSTAARPGRTYTAKGYVTVGLRVTDASGSSATASVRLTIGTPPTATITAPGPERWAAGDRLAFAGTARDAAGAALPASALRWTLDLRHCSALVPTSCHTHRMQDFAGVARGSFIAPDHDYPSHLELGLTATDGDGLQTTRTLRLDPRTVALTVRSDPPGLRLVLGGESEATPFTREVIANAKPTLSAGTPQALGERSEVFGAWSDGQPATHVVTAAADATYTATYGELPDLALAGTDAVRPDSVSVAVPGRGEAYRVTAAKTGVALGLRLRLAPGSEATRLVLGLYADAAGEPGALLASGIVAAPVADAWNSVRLSRGMALAAGRPYWFALLNPLDSGGPLRWHDRAQLPLGQERTSGGPLVSALPANWFTGHAYDDGAPVSGGAFGPDPDAPFPTPTPVPAPTPRATARAPATRPRPRRRSRASPRRAARCGSRPGASRCAWRARRRPARTAG